MRSQLEKYIKEQLGAARLSAGKNTDELRKITKEIAALKKKLLGLEARKAELEIVVRPSQAKR